jgi:uncharacterized protein (TIGR03435 family)
VYFIWMVRLIIASLTVLVLSGQSGPGTPSFEVASLKQSPPRTGEARYIKMSSDPGRIAYTNMRLKLLISFAYGINDDRITGGADWIDSTPYDLIATFPPQTTKEQVSQMLQGLLVERFGLQVERRTKTMSGYELVVGKHGPKLAKAQSANKGGNYILKGRIGGPNMPIGVLAGILSRQTGQPVSDKTGIEGEFDITVTFAPESGANVENAQPPVGPSIYTAVQEQLGLQLRPAKVPAEFLVILHADKTPVENN